VYHKRWQAKLGDETAEFEAEVVETDSPTNPGDSGGPLVNDKSELVGVTQGGSVNARLVSTFIDLSEVKQFLNSTEVKAIRGPGGESAARDRALGVADGGKYFSPEAVRKANEEVRDLFRKFGRDLLVETYPGVPDDQAEKVKEMSREEKAKFFADWCRQRIREKEVNGLLILVCRQPTYLYVEPSPGARNVFDKEAVKELVDTLMERFRAKEFDQGLADAVRLVRERLERAAGKP
jgi:hypothetical protein